MKNTDLVVKIKLFGGYILMFALWMFIVNISIAQIPTAGLVGYWPFNGNANDMSGNGNHGTLGGANGGPVLTTDRFGNANSCYQFGGYNNPNWIDVPNSSSLQLDTTVSVSFWIQECFNGGMDGGAGFSTTEYNYAVIAKGGDGWSCPPGLWIFTNHSSSNTNGFFGLLLSNTVSNGNFIIHDDGPRDNCFNVNSCDWLHCVIVIDGRHVKYYWNSVVVMDTIFPSCVNFVAANTHDMHIGIEGGYFWNPRDGKLDDIAIYNRAITQDEISQLFGQFYDVSTYVQLHQITIDSIIVETACGGNNGTVQVFPDNINGPYQYALDYPDNFQSSNLLQNISTGVHRIYIKSACGIIDTLIDFTCIEELLPDNVDSATCTVASIGHDWGIGIDWSSETMVSPLVIPLVGDINGDQVPEIVCLAPNDNHTYYGSTKVLVFNTLTHQVIHTVNLPDVASTVDAAPYGMIKLPNGHVILVVALRNYMMYAYDLTAGGTTPLWSVTIDHNAPNVSFADFNGDTYPDIYICNKIYDAETGTLLISDPAITNTAAAFTHVSMGGQLALSSPCVANVVGDARPDLILGNEIYEVNITNRTGLAGNSISLAQSITPPAGVAVDGHPQVADFNLDGHLDVLITNKNSEYADVGFYVWDVFQNTVSAPVIFTTNGNGMSIPLIADIDGDDMLELVIQCNASTGEKVKAYKYDISTSSFTFMWDINVDEDSYSNSMSVFDFNNDGENDLLISDQTTVRIVNGSGHSHLTGNDTIPVYTLTSLSFGECTVMQYPIVADVDADGSAELLVLGRFGSGHTYQAYLNVFKSASTPWAAARKVWNQYMYNVTNVNEDLTVPQYLFNNATAFTDPQGVVRRPFNNFLQQATTIDQYGRPFYAVTDVALTNLNQQIVSDSTVITLTLCNQGDINLVAPYYITVYAGTYGGTVIRTVDVNNNLMVDSCTTLAFSIGNVDFCNMPNINNLIVSVNDAGTGIAQEGGQQPECDTTNNRSSLPVTIHAINYEMSVTSCEPYTWFGDILTQSGDYTYTANVGTGCDSIITLHLTIPPTPSVQHSPDTVILPGATVDLWASGTDILSWSDATGAVISNNGNVSVSPNQTSVYHIYGQNLGGTTGDNLVVNGDFEQGNTGFTSAYTYSSNLWPEGYYYVGSNAHNYHTNFPNWYDHTSGAGNYMIINGATVPNTNVWTQTVNVSPNTDYAFATWVCSLTFGTQGGGAAQLQFSINGTQIGNVFSAPLTTGWQRFYEVWNSGNNTTATITILNQNTGGDLNDFGIDDISFAPLSCPYNDSVVVVVAALVDSAVCDNMFPFVWNGHTFTEPGTASVIIPAQNGLDSAVVMTVTILPTSHTVIEDRICQNDGYAASGFYLSAEETSITGLNIFTDTLSNHVGCDSVVELHLTVVPMVVPAFYADPDKMVLSESALTQLVNTTDTTGLGQWYYRWIWDFGDDTGDTTWEYHNQHEYMQMGEYVVTLTLEAEQLCENSFSYTVYVEDELKYPNVITPNGDGVNDVFAIVNLNPDRPNRLIVYDRWGKKVFDKENYQTYMKDDRLYNASEGFGAENLPDGVYYYTFYCEGYSRAFNHHSSLTVIRER